MILLIRARVYGDDGCILGHLIPIVLASLYTQLPSAAPDTCASLSIIYLPHAWLEHAPRAGRLIQPRFSRTSVVDQTLLQVARTWSPRAAPRPQSWGNPHLYALSLS